MNATFENIVISDSVIITLESVEDNDVNLSNFRDFLLSINYIQIRLAAEDIWIRGAITYGDTFNKDNQIVGPAYIDAYVLEGQKAIFPRIIIDPKLISLFKCTNAESFIKLINQHKFRPNVNLVFDWNCGDGTKIDIIEQDVPFFLDYMSILYNDDPENIKILIEHISKNIYSDISIYVKFKWIVKYLKAVVIKGEKKEISLPPDTIDILETL